MKYKFMTNKKISSNFILLYFFTILLFAIIYTRIANQFYYSTSKYENILDEELRIIEKQIKISIINNFKSYHKSSVIYLDSNKNWVFFIGDLEIKKIDLNMDELTLDISLCIINMSNIEKKYITTVYLKVNNEDKFIIEDYVYRLGKINFKDNITDILIVERINYSQIFYLEIDNTPKYSIGLKLSSKLEKKINEFINSADGLPSRNNSNSLIKFKSNFPRMLYLSMVTITTLGYGDIVPLTNTARILIGIESTLGIIIIGWFVNSKVNNR